MLLTDVMTYLMKGTLTNIKGVLRGDGKTLGEVGVDSTPTAGSENLIDSDAVKRAIIAAGDMSNPTPITATSSNHADLNAFTTPGIYSCTSSSIIPFIDNAPSIGAFTFVLEVIKVGSTSVMQIIMRQEAVWVRKVYTTTTAPTSWLNISSYQGDVPDGTDLNDVMEIGYYSLVGGREYLNFPGTFTNKWGVLEVISGRESSSQRIQRLTRQGEIYFRYLLSSGWGSWYSVTCTQV